MKFGRLAGAKVARKNRKMMVVPLFLVGFCIY
jgi:hypothetical protein